MPKQEKLPKLIVIVGPTASGKTNLGIHIAQKFNGEVVSADSRQIYREFNIGTAKPEGHWMRLGGRSVYSVQGIPHYLVDELDPKEDFTLRDFKDRAVAAIKDVLERGKLPILLGGTALYVYAVTDNLHIPEVRANRALRSRLEGKSPAILYAELKKRDPQAAELTGLNKRRIIRALEVIEATGHKFSTQRTKGPRLFNTLKLGPAVTKPELKNRIETRTQAMVKAGLLKEVKGLAKRYPWELPPMQSVDYQEFKEYLAGEAELEPTLAIVNKHHQELGRRQMLWFKKDKEVQWVKSPQEAEKLVEQFLKN